MQFPIEYKNVDITYPIYNASAFSLRNFLLGKKSKVSFIHALKNINLKIEHGEKVGIYGPNGSGKSTFLRSVLGTYQPIKGEIVTHGKIGSMIDLGIGFDHEASGMDNILLKLGIEDIKLKKDKVLIDKIVNFSDLGESLNLPIYSYSSGMLMRLAFSISINLDYDILLLDEWLSVGDSNFSSKSQAALTTKINDSSVVMLASHSIDLLKQTCSRIIYLDNGNIISDEKN